MIPLQEQGNNVKIPANESRDISIQSRFGTLLKKMHLRGGHEHLDPTSKTELGIETLGPRRQVA